MGGKKGGENTKKVSGNARKAEVAAQKQAEQDSRKAKHEDEEWSKGAKSTAKKYVYCRVTRIHLNDIEHL